MALDSEQSELTTRVVLEREEWLDYFFGICKPDRRNGKQGSRYFYKAGVSVRLEGVHYHARHLESPFLGEHD